MAVTPLVIAVFTDSQLSLIVAIVIAGAFIGVNNTLVTSAVMTVSPAQRSIASVVAVLLVSVVLSVGIVDALSVGVAEPS